MNQILQSPPARTQESQVPLQTQSLQLTTTHIPHLPFQAQSVQVNGTCMSQVPF